MQRQSFNLGRYAEIWLLAYPTIVAMVLHNFMRIIDTIMIGRVGTAALAGVSLAQLVLATLFYLHKGVADSVLTFTAQYAGADQKMRCGAMAWQGLYLGGGVALLTLLLIPMVTPLFVLMKPAAEAMVPGITYLRVALLGSSVEALTLLLVYFMRGLGDTKTPMRISVLGNVLNIAGNYVLIFGHFGAPRLGVLGAAISTTVSECVVLVLLFTIFLSRRVAAQYGTRRLVPPRWEALRRIGNLAAPIGLQGLLEVGSFTLFTVMIARMGTAQLALSHIVLQLIIFAFLPVQGLSVAVSTLVGKYLGRENAASAEQSGRHALHIGMLYMGGLGLLFLCAPQVCLRLFTRDPEVLAMGTTLLRVAGAVQVFDAMYWVSCGVLKGAGDTRWMMVVGTVYNWLVFLPLAYLFGIVYDGGLLGAWIGFALMVLFQGLTFWGRVKRGGWKALSLLRPEERLSDSV